MNDMRKKRDVRALMFCRVTSQDKEDVHTKEYLRLIQEAGNNGKLFFALGSFDVISVYPIENTEGSDWFGKVYEDKKEKIAQLHPNISYHQMHIVSENTNQTAFWDAPVDKYPFFMATFVYGVRREDEHPEAGSVGCSTYERYMNYWLSKPQKDTDTLKADEKMIYAVYNGISISDVVILWKSNDLYATLDRIAEIEMTGSARRTMTTVCLPLMVKGNENSGRTIAFEDPVLSELKKWTTYPFRFGEQFETEKLLISSGKKSRTFWEKATRTSISVTEKMISQLQQKPMVGDSAIC
jgi:hypothetical protein